MPTTRDRRTIVAVTGEDDRFDAIRSRASAIAAGSGSTVILYDIDAAGVFASPVPTGWSGDGEKELLDEEASHDRLDDAALETAGRGAIARQVRSMRAMGVDAWGWLPTKRDAADLAAYAARQGADLVLVPGDLAPADAGRPSDTDTATPRPVFETVE
jgi:hypothetical protein